MVGYNYDQYTSMLADELGVDQTDSNFSALLPSVAAYAENRIYRDLNLIATVVVDATVSTTANSRYASLPLLGYLVIQDINVITPANTIVDQGTRNPLIPVSLEVLDFEWPDQVVLTTPSIPQKFAMVTPGQIALGPIPDAAYTLECFGTVRPAPIQTLNPTTYLTEALPDLFFAASMIAATGFARTFPAMSSNPQNGVVSWEAQYKTLLASADAEEARRKYSSASWTPKKLEPNAAPQRG